mmetsp:Transcript_7099/g.31152  ORF Transcript_7099/g.31152 Transcript_7099/m.31152 type:complete len:213 (+) Transcript_7099:2379-3017(+)
MEAPEEEAVVAVHHAEERPRGHVERGLHLVLPHGRRPWTRRRRAECVTRPNYYPRGNGSVLASHTELCPNEQSDGLNRGPCRVTDGSRRCWSGRSLHRMGRLLARHRTGSPWSSRRSVSRVQFPTSTTARSSSGTCDRPFLSTSPRATQPSSIATGTSRGPRRWCPYSSPSASRASTNASSRPPTSSRGAGTSPRSSARRGTRETLGTWRLN